MSKLLAALMASAFIVFGTNALAADTPKETTKTAKAALERPSNVTVEAWNKMSDAEKAKAVEAAKNGGNMAKAGKKEKKGGC